MILPYADLAEEIHENRLMLRMGLDEIQDGKKMGLQPWDITSVRTVEIIDNGTQFPEFPFDFRWRHDFDI